MSRALEAGADCIQAREGTVRRELLSRARRLRNDARARRGWSSTIARTSRALAEADGVHLGQTDLPVGEARASSATACASA